MIKNLYKYFCIPVYFHCICFFVQFILDRKQLQFIQLQLYFLCVKPYIGTLWIGILCQVKGIA